MRKNPLLQLPARSCRKLPFGQNLFFLVSGVMGMDHQISVGCYLPPSPTVIVVTFPPRAVLPGLPYRLLGSFGPAPRFWPRRRRYARQPRRRGRSCSPWSWRQRRCGRDGGCARLCKVREEVGGRRRVLGQELHIMRLGKVRGWVVVVESPRMWDGPMGEAENILIATNTTALQSPLAGGVGA